MSDRLHQQSETVVSNKMSDPKPTTLNAAAVAKIAGRKVDDLEETWVGDGQVFIVKRQRPRGCIIMLMLLCLLVLGAITLSGGLQVNAALDKVEMLEKELEASVLESTFLDFPAENGQMGKRQLEKVLESSVDEPTFTVNLNARDLPAAPSSTKKRSRPFPLNLLPFPECEEVSHLCNYCRTGERAPRDDDGIVGEWIDDTLCWIIGEHVPDPAMIHDAPSAHKRIPEAKDDRDLGALERRDQDPVTELMSTGFGLRSCLLEAENAGDVVACLPLNPMEVKNVVEPEDPALQPSLFPEFTTLRSCLLQVENTGDVNACLPLHLNGLDVVKRDGQAPESTSLPVFEEFSSCINPFESIEKAKACLRIMKKMDNAFQREALNSPSNHFEAFLLRHPCLLKVETDEEVQMCLHRHDKDEDDMRVVAELVALLRSPCMLKAGSNEDIKRCLPGTPFEDGDHKERRFLLQTFLRYPCLLQAEGIEEMKTCVHGHRLEERKDVTKLEEGLNAEPNRFSAFLRRHPCLLKVETSEEFETCLHRHDDLKDDAGLQVVTDILALLHGPCMLKAESDADIKKCVHGTQFEEGMHKDDVTFVSILLRYPCLLEAEGEEEFSKCLHRHHHQEERETKMEKRGSDDYPEIPGETPDNCSILFHDSIEGGCDEDTVEEYRRNIPGVPAEMREDQDNTESEAWTTFCDLQDPTCLPSDWQNDGIGPRVEHMPVEMQDARLPTWEECMSMGAACEIESPPCRAWIESCDAVLSAMVKAEDHQDDDCPIPADLPKGTFVHCIKKNERRRVSSWFKGLSNLMFGADTDAVRGAKTAESS